MKGGSASRQCDVAKDRPGRDRHFLNGESYRRDPERAARIWKLDTERTICTRLHDRRRAANLDVRSRNGSVVLFVDDLSCYYILGECSAGKEEKGCYPA